MKGGLLKIRFKPFSILYFLFSTFSLFLLVACNPTTLATPPPPVVLTAAGSTSMTPLMTRLAAAYSAQQPHISFDIRGGDSRLGQTLVETGQVDLGLMSSPPVNLPSTLQAIPIGRDAIAIIVHPQNRLTDLSLAEVRDIFSGRRLVWTEAAGITGDIQVVSREDGSGTRASFEGQVMEDQSVTPTAVVLPNSQAVVDFVAQNPAAIAYVAHPMLHNRVHALRLNGLTPNPSGNDYPLTRPLFLLASQQSRPEVTRFIEFGLSPAGQAIIAETQP